jgi:hypothetical protein
MQEWFVRQSMEVRLLAAGGGVVLAALIVVACVALIGGGGGSTISDGAPCEDFVKANSGQQRDYLNSKLHAASSQEGVAYAEGIEINCSKGYPNSTTGREFEATQSEIAEAEAEGSDLNEAVALIRQRTEERETYGDLTEELEGP